MELGATAEPTTTQKQYFYLTEGINQSSRLVVDEADVLINADGELDCSIETTLRKNGYSIYDLMSWETREIKLILVEDGVEQSLRAIEVHLSLE